MVVMEKINWARTSLCAVFITIGLLIAFFLLGVIGPVDFGKDAPAWVQAVGSIAAILIAVAVPAVQHWLSRQAMRRESLDRARSLGLRLLPDIQAFAGRHDVVWSAEHPDHDVLDEGENACFLGFRTKLALMVPAGIAAEVGRLHELGGAAEGLQRAIYNVGRASELLTTVQVTVETGPFLNSIEHKTLITNKAEFYDLMWDALVGLTRSQSRIESFFEHGSRPLQDPGRRPSGPSHAST